MKPTKEQIEQALSIVSCEVETHRHDMAPTLEQSYRVLLSAIPALTAELESERKAHAEMGAEEVPSPRDIGRMVSKIEPWENYSEGHLYERRGQAVLDLLAPVLGARRALECATSFGTLTDSDKADGFVADAAGNVCSLDGRVMLHGDPATAALLVETHNASFAKTKTDDEEFTNALDAFVKEQDEAAAHNDYAYEAWVRGLRPMKATQRLLGLLATRWR